MSKLIMNKEIFEKVKLTKIEWNTLNTYVEYKESRRKCASVLCYIKKHITLNSGKWRKSFKNIHAMYNRYHVKMSIANFKKIVNKLIDLKLILVIKDRKTNVYNLPISEKVTEKVTNLKANESVDFSSLYDDFEKPREKNYENFNILNTKKNLVDYLKSFYKGVKANLIATKKQLRDIAKSLLVAKRLHSNTTTDRAIQYLVFKKIKHSNQKINLIGAVSYLDKVIEDRLDAFKKGLVEVPDYITGEVSLRFNDFGNKREYDYNDLENKLLGWE